MMEMAWRRCENFSKQSPQIDFIFVHKDTHTEWEHEQHGN